MPEQGNKKYYIGDVVVNEDNEKYQRQFFEDIIKTFFGHGNGLDADTVDGYHAYCFATVEQGKKADNALQSPLSIGTETNLKNSTETGYQWISDEGIKIHKDFIQDDIIKTFKKLNIGNLEDYFGGKTEEELNEGMNSAFHTNLSVILPGIWRILQKQFENTVYKREGYDLSQNDFTDEYKAKIDIFGNKIKTIQCEEGIEKQILDADAVNGLQFFLVTQAQYDALTDYQKNYWRNVFILVDETPEGYESPALCTFKSGYDFKIESCKMLYKPTQAKEWNVMYDFDSLQTVFDCHVMKSLSKQNAPSLDNKDYLNYPFISSELIPKFVNSIECKGTYNSEAIDITFDETTNSDSKLSTVNIFKLYKTISDFFNDKIKTLNNSISTLRSDFTTFKNDINTNFNTFKTNITNDLTKFKQDVSVTYATKTELSEIQKSLSSLITKNTNDIKNIVDTFEKKVNDLINKNRLKYSLRINIDNTQVGTTSNTHEIPNIPIYTTKKGSALYIRLTDGNNESPAGFGQILEHNHFALINLNNVMYIRPIRNYDFVSGTPIKTKTTWTGIQMNINLNAGEYICYLMIPNSFSQKIGYNGEYSGQSCVFVLKVTG